MLANTNHGDGDANHHQASPPPLTGTLIARVYQQRHLHGSRQYLTVTLSSPVTATTRSHLCHHRDHHGHQQRQLRDANRRQPYVVTVAMTPKPGAKNVSFWDNHNNAALITQRRPGLAEGREPPQ